MKPGARLLAGGIIEERLASPVEALARASSRRPFPLGSLVYVNLYDNPADPTERYAEDQGIVTDTWLPPEGLELEEEVPAPDLTAISTTTVPARAKAASKLPAEVTQTVARLEAGSQPSGTGGTFSDSGVPVRDGKLQLELHAAAPVTDAQRAELGALGADIVAAGTAADVVDAWVPYARVEDAAALPWVVAVTVPSPTRAP